MGVFTFSNLMAAIQMNGLGESFLLPMILNMSITGSLAILFVLLVRLALKRVPKIFSYALWAVVLFRLLCPVSITTDFSLLGLFDTPIMENTEHTTAMEYVPFDVVHTRDLEVHLPVAPIINEAVNDVLPQEHAALGADPLEGEMAIASFVWLLGVGAMAVYSVISYLQLRRRLLTASRLRENIYLADEITSPFVMGLIRPKIYLPSDMEGREQTYIIRHEQHHIRRGDHIIKALAFLALTIHWFNPLVWVAFIYSNKDMEMSCDEAVVKKMGADILADYTASLLSLATGKHIIAGMPLAFGEGDTKGRIRNLANWRKPAFWVVLVAVIACIALSVGLITNPAAEREFPINGSNVSELETERVVEMIAKAEKLEDGSQLCVNGSNFDLMFTADFNWANDGAIRFFYLKNQKTYGAQLRMFHDDNKYFITDSEEWIEQEQIFKLFHYLDALKYMPQEEIRQLSPDADGYSVFMRQNGVPDEYERVLRYSWNGVGETNGWNIHLEVHPLHKADGGGYFGSGDEVIHIFYGAGVKQSSDTPSEVQKIEINDVFFTFDGKSYDLSERNGSINEITDSFQIGEYIVLVGHTGPKHGVYCVFNTRTQTFEADILGANLTWYGDDINTAVYSYWSDIFTYDGKCLASYELSESEYIYSLEYTEDGLQIEALILSDTGDERIEIISPNAHVVS